MDNFFQIKQRGTTLKTEIYSGFVTFLAMSYILAVNPAILSGIDGMDKGAIFTATALAAAIATFIMGFFANYPVMLAPGMSMNSFFKGLLVSGAITLAWNEALLGIFISGFIYLIFSMTPARRKIIEAIPEDLKSGIAVSLGLFITFIGLKNSGVIVSNPFVLVGLGDVFAPKTAIAIISIFVAIGFMVRDIKLATVISFLTAILLSLVSDTFFGTDLITLPDSVVSLPPSVAPTFGAIFDVSNLTAVELKDLFFIVIIFFIVDFFDGLSTLVGVGKDAGIITDNKVPNAKSALLADSGGTMIGAMLGTTSITCYSESGVASSLGAKTGASSMVVAGLFLLSLFLFPIFSIFTTSIVAPAMVVIGIYMIGNVAKVDWEKQEYRVSVFFTMVFSLLTFSPANGMAMGFISYCFVMLVLGKGKEVHPLLYALGALFVLYLTL